MSMTKGPLSRTARCAGLNISSGGRLLIIQGPIANWSSPCRAGRGELWTERVMGFALGSEKVDRCGEAHPEVRAPTFRPEPPLTCRGYYPS